MKLYPILYFEAARTVADSLEKNIAARLLYDDTVVLFSIPQMNEIISNAMKSPLYNIDFEAWKKRAIESLSNSAIVATVSFELITSGLYQVSTSAGIDRFGPLAYQLVMQEIKKTNSWLKSDASVSSKAHNVWNKMYAFSDLYERKWIGDFNSLYIKTALRTHAIKNYDPSKHGTTEAEVATFLGGTGPNSQEIFKNYGNLFAYRLINDIADYKKLYDKGEMFFSEIGKYDISEKDFKHIFDKASSRFFSRLSK